MEKIYSLTSENIDSISEEIAEFFKGKKQLTVPPVYGGCYCCETGRKIKRKLGGIL